MVWVLGFSLAVSIGAMTMGLVSRQARTCHGADGVPFVPCELWRRHLSHGERRLSGKRLRLLNEVPGIAVALIVILVIVKPF